MTQESIRSSWADSLERALSRGRDRKSIILSPGQARELVEALRDRGNAYVAAEQPACFKERMYADIDLGAMFEGELEPIDPICST